MMYRHRNALEVAYLSVLSISISRTAFFLQPLPASLAQSPVLGRTAAIVLFVGCVGAVIGIFWKDHDKSLLIEQFFMAWCVAGFFGYAFALAQAQPFASAAFAFGMTLGLGLACVVRFVQIQRYVAWRRDRQHLKEVGDGP